MDMHDMYNCFLRNNGYGWIVWQNPIIHPQMVGRLLGVPLIDISDATYVSHLVEEELHLVKNGPFIVDFLVKVVILHSHVSLPEGTFKC